MSAVDQLPTLPGKAPGIVGWDPLVQQCRECGRREVATTSKVGFEILRSGYRFHTCDAGSGRRLCPDCLLAAEAACPYVGRHA